MKITKNFDSSEIKCPCCGDTNIRLKTVELAQAIRDELKQPVYVPEGGGKRCSAYQDTIGDYVSAHESGDAIDLYIKPYKLANMLTIAHLGKELGATRIGLYPEYHVKSVHLDLFPIIKSESWVRTIKRGYIYFKHFESAVKYVKENYL
jgi:hypothetical protein